MAAYNAYKGRERPIWCCTGIEEADIVNGAFSIDNKILVDFYKGSINEGKAVLIDYKTFLELIYRNPYEYGNGFSFFLYMQPTVAFYANSNYIDLNSG